MKVIYAVAVIVLISIIGLLIGSFLYLERGRHQIFFFSVSSSAGETASIKIDSYKTENKILISSVDHKPFEPYFTKSSKKLVLGRKGWVFVRYNEENISSSTAQSLLIEAKDGYVKFLCIAGPEFSAASIAAPRAPHHVYEYDSLIFYMPLIEKYNFKKGGSQSFDTLCPAEVFLPPYIAKAVLTSIRDEYIEVFGKRVKTECLVVKSKGRPEAYLWVAKSDHAISRFEIPSLGLKFKRVSNLPSINSMEYRISDPACVSSNVSFKNADTVLAGILSEPANKTPNQSYPAILALSGRDLFDMNCGGIFTTLANHLAKKGFFVLRYDLRGTGKSGGNRAAITLSEDIGDARAAYEYLKAVPSVDKNKIAVLGHGKGAYTACALILSGADAAACILMGYNAPLAPVNFLSVRSKEKIVELTANDENYPKIVEIVQSETKKFASESKKDWSSVFGSKVYAKRMLEEFELSDSALWNKVNIPLLILQGKKDKDANEDYFKNIPEKVVYFRNLGYYFGELTSVDGSGTQIHYEIDREVPEAIANWLNDNMVNIKPAPQPAPEEEVKPMENQPAPFDKNQNL